MRLLLVLLATCVCSVGVRAEADVDYVADTNDGLDSPDAMAADDDYVEEEAAAADVDYEEEGGVQVGLTMTDHGIPITIEQPSGHHKLNLRYHLAHYGAVPYGQEFSAYASININCPSITAD